MTHNDNEISDLFFQNVPEPEPQDDSKEEKNSPDSDLIQNSEEEILSEEKESSIEPEKEPETELKAESETEEASASDTVAETHYETAVVKKKRSKLAPVVGICILLAVTITAIWYVVSHGDSSKDASNDISLKKIFNFSSPIDEATGINELSEMFANQPSKVNASITVTSVDGSPDASGVGVDYTFMRNPDKKTTSAEIALSYRKAAILSATMYVDKDDICFKVPSLSSGVFTIKASNIGTQIENSPLLKESLEEDDTTLQDMKPFLERLNTINRDSLFSNFACSTSDSDIISEIVNRIADNYPDDYKKIVDGITSESIEADTSGNVGTKITISEQSVELFVKDLLTLAFDDKECKDFLIEYFELIYSSAYFDYDEDSDINATNIDEFISKFFTQSRTSLVTAGTMFATYFNQDIIVTVYQNAKGELVSLTSKNTIDINGETIDVDFFISSQTPENPTDSMTFELNISADGETVNIKFINLCNRNSETLKHNQALIISSNGEVTTINNNRTYNIATGKYESLFKCSQNSDTIFAFNMDCTFKKIEKGNNYNIIIDYVDIMSEDTILFSATGEINASKLTEDIMKPSGTEYKILEMSEEELAPIIEEFSKNADSLDGILNDYGLND